MATAAVVLATAAVELATAVASLSVASKERTRALALADERRLRAAPLQRAVGIRVSRYTKGWPATELPRQ